jgi:Outer membrane protein transport protein (OMPP1/FadL/TodX)
MKRMKKIYFAFCICQCFLMLHAVTSKAQTGTETPYSRYGIGELLFNGFANQSAMGGIGAAYHNASAINFSNPASYASTRISTFETAIRGELAKATTSSVSENKKGTLLNYLSLGFPVMKDNWGASFGLIPVSASGYNLKTTSSVNNVNDTVNSTYDVLYNGKGGLSRFYLGNGFAPWSKGLEKFYKSANYQQLLAANDTVAINKLVRNKKLLKGISFGFNASYLFGSLSNERRVRYNSSAFINTKITDNVSYSDFYFDYGFIYEYEFKNNYKLSVGASAAAGTNIKGRQDFLWALVSSSSIESNIDTVQFIEGRQGKTFIPASVTAGFMLKKGEKWLVGADYSIQQWSKFRSFNATKSDDKLKDSYKISLGGQYAPTEKLAYRAGFRYGKSYLNLNNTAINDYAVSAGLGIPVRLSSAERRLYDNKTMLHFTVEAGQQGTTSNNLIRKDYVRFYVGITANELWFIKRKYD